MKLPDIYTDWRVALGAALIALGAGNWIIGLQRTEMYSRTVAAAGAASSPADYRNFDALDDEAGGAVLEPITSEQEQLSYATARMDFYHAAFIAGRTMALCGVLITLVGFVGIIQRDTRRAIRAGAAAASGPPPGRDG
ncbi:MAG TPA: hypothetical protein VMU16_10395 [Candidatus Binataceae bacterium]|nr:hypothetical protein [Candidatus Binataceae bacterium]